MSELTTDFHYHSANDTLIVESSQDVEPILKANKEARNSGDGYSPSRELRRVASIPEVVAIIWMKEGINIYNPDHWPLVKKKLDSAEWSCLKTAGAVTSRIVVPDSIKSLEEKPSEDIKVVDKRVYKDIDVDNKLL